MIEKLMDYMSQSKIEGFFVSRPQNVRYVSGYTSDDAYLLISNKGNYFLTDPRYTEQASMECPSYNIINWREKGKSIIDAVKFVSDSLKLKSIAFESDNINHKMYVEMLEMNVELVPVIGVIENFRSIKTPKEIAYLRAACQITDRAFDRIIKDIRVGVTEKELASKLSHYMVMEGADTKPYGNILISGKRTSLLHGIPSNKVVEYGDFVLMDYGCGFNGYLSDMTRTVIVGNPTDEQKKVYELEKAMESDAMKVMKPGVKGKDVYKASLKAIEGTEYMQYHYSNIGHGIGVFVHEMPSMSPTVDDVLKVNNVITIEPGIYIPNWGGVRIEDQLLITEDGNECMTTSTRELVIL